MNIRQSDKLLSTRWCYRIKCKSLLLQSFWIFWTNLLKEYKWNQICLSGNRIHNFCWLQFLKGETFKFYFHSIKLLVVRSLKLLLRVHLITGTLWQSEKIYILFSYSEIKWMSCLKMVPADYHIFLSFHIFGRDRHCVLALFTIFWPSTWEPQLYSHSH